MRITIEPDIEGETEALVYDHVVEYALVGAIAAVKEGKILKLGDIPAIRSFSHRSGEPLQLIERLLGLVERIKVTLNGRNDTSQC